MKYMKSFFFFPIEVFYLVLYYLHNRTWGSVLQYMCTDVEDL